MSAPTIDRTNYNALVDDSGGNVDGTVWNKNQIKIVILDAIDALAASLFAAISGAAARATNGAQTIATGASTALTFSAETFDTASLHSTSSNTSRMTVGATGVYDITGFVKWTGSASGNQRQVAIRVNGLTTYNEAYLPPSGGINLAMIVNDKLSLTAGDYVEIMAFQDTGGNLATIGASFAIAQVS